jgi:bacillopeptidase F
VSDSNIVSSSNFVFTIAQPTQNYFSDEFENGLSNWIVSGQDWGLTNTTSRGGSYCITESPIGNYGINGNFIIVLANAIDLSTSTNPILTFWHKYYSEFYDYCRVDISKDGGTTWSELERYNYTQKTLKYDFDLHLTQQITMMGGT